MKRARTAWIVVIVLLALGGLAQAIELGAVTLRDAAGSSIGRVDADGTLRDDSGRSIGRIDRDGTVRGASGSSIGRVDADGTIRGATGSSAGRIDRDGTIRDATGRSVGRADGYAPGLRHLVAAVLFFGGSASVLRR